jgi:hypothetical protein
MHLSTINLLFTIQASKIPQIIRSKMRKNCPEEEVEEGEKAERL